MRISPVIAIKKRIQNGISDPKQERCRDKGNDGNADLMYKPPREESNIYINRRANKKRAPRDPQTFS
jgi:hypothetical protein